MNITLHIFPTKIFNRLSPLMKKAQIWLDNEVLKDTTPYVPMQTGNLKESGISGTVKGSGHIKYTAPYARSCYYGKSRKFSKHAHPQACAQWFEPAKSVNKKKWVSGARKIAKGG